MLRRSPRLAEKAAKKSLEPVTDKRVLREAYMTANTDFLRLAAWGWHTMSTDGVSDEMKAKILSETARYHVLHAALKKAKDAYTRSNERIP